ncbi:MAG TPA: TIGR03885 family FMN-dependent LLM class oxidoreductase [Stenotrophomonas sp.]|jgi:probable non-F420 flavinoid oxidoreductase
MIGYHASHEQFDPAELLGHARRAEQAGFQALMCSDHFHPWTAGQGQSGQSWVWAGAAVAGSSLSIGMVTCPYLRYHPAIVAQALATLERLASGHCWLAVGSGEALNERVCGLPWPEKAERHARLLDAAEVMRALWRGEAVERRDQCPPVGPARLYTIPQRPIPLLGAALTEDTARWLGGWADGLITVNLPMPRLRALVDAFRDGGGEGKPLYLQVKLSYAETEAEAIAGAMDQWRCNVLPAPVAESLSRPEDFSALAELVDEDRMREHVRVSSDVGQHAAWLAEYRALGFERLYLHNVNRGQSRFIDDFGACVLPLLVDQDANVNQA